MAARLTLICHAPTAAVRAAAFPLDEPIDISGIAKAQALAGTLKRADEVRTSPARRARETASAMDLEATVDPALADCDYGRWAGRDFDEIAAVEPSALAAWTCDPTGAPHGGESVCDLVARAAEWLDVRMHEGKRALAITHAAVIRAAIVHAIDAAPHCFWRIDIAPLTRVELRADRRRWTLRSIHLSP